MTPMPLIIRPLTSEDLSVLEPLDASYCRDTGSEVQVTSQSLSFYERSGHSFVLEVTGEATGFLLAQAVWDGRRPTVHARRLVAPGDAGRRALIEALTKSAYDAGVYDLIVEIPQNDAASELSLAACGYSSRPTKLYSRVLGSRSRAS